MMQIVLMGLGSGTAAAVLFASVASGSLFSIFLFYLAPLPILIVGLGWSHWSALIAAVTASALLAIEGPLLVVTFLIGVALPAWWLGYLALLARPASPGEEQEWYPAGRLVLWGAGLAGLIVIATLVSLGGDAASVRESLREMLEGLLREFVGSAEQPQDSARLIDMLVLAAPAAAAAATSVVILLNLWLAGRIVRISGRLRRPWPDVPAMQFPPLAPLALALAMAGSFLPDFIGIAASALAAALMMAHVLLGLAVIHALTTALAARGVILTAVYAGIVLLGRPVSWPLILLGILGIADTLFDIRGQVARRRALALLPNPRAQAGERETDVSEGEDKWK
jgi:hypothetical protein